MNLISLYFILQYILYKSKNVLLFYVFFILFYMSHKFVHFVYVYPCTKFFSNFSRSLFLTFYVYNIDIVDLCTDPVIWINLYFTTVKSRNSMMGQSNWNVMVMNTRIVPTSLPFRNNSLPFHFTPMLDRPSLIPSLRCHVTYNFYCAKSVQTSRFAFMYIDIKNIFINL